MAVLAVTYTLANGQTSDQSLWNTNYSDIVTWLNNRYNGTDTWSFVKVSSTNANPMECKSSAASAEFDIDCTGTNGTPILTWRRSGSTYFSAGVDGAASNLFKFGTTALTTNVAFQVPTTGVQVQFATGSAATPSISAIGVVDKGMYFGSNLIAWSIGGSRIAQLDTSNGLTVDVGQVNVNVANNASTPTFAIGTGVGMYRTAANRLAFAVNSTLAYEFLATQHNWYISGVQTLLHNATAFDPVGAGTISSGTASNYWNDISYKTLTDRGCLGWFDDGVELQDGRIVSDCEAIASIQKHPTKKTIYGKEMLDYRTFPKVTYKKADMNGKFLPRDKNNEPIGGNDGIEMTSMQSIMLGAIKELHSRLARVEVKVA